VDEKFFSRVLSHKHDFMSSDFFCESRIFDHQNVLIESKQTLSGFKGLLAVGDHLEGGPGEAVIRM
jgi:hypothetical protein